MTTLLGLLGLNTFSFLFMGWVWNGRSNISNLFIKMILIILGFTSGLIFYSQIQVDIQSMYLYTLVGISSFVSGIFWIIWNSSDLRNYLIKVLFAIQTIWGLVEIGVKVSNYLISAAGS